MRPLEDIAAVVIGRNEGERLIDCLASLQDKVGRIVYVDSGSTDGSVEAARARSAEIVCLDREKPFTAARARNAGFAQLTDKGQNPAYVQFIDGDCRLHPDWVKTACAFLETYPQAAVACGRRRERFPEKSVYNRLIDAEWDTPLGRTRSCGGDALIRIEALHAVGGYDPGLIAGEEPELCVRLRGRGWEIWRLDADMTLHDAALTRFGQWWQRTRRGGYAYAEGAAMHGAMPERHCVPELRRIIVWGVALPILTILGALVTPWALVLLLAWPMQVLRLRLRGFAWHRALFLALSKLPEAQGALTYWWRRLTRAGTRLIEYK